MAEWSRLVSHPVGPSTPEADPRRRVETRWAVDRYDSDAYGVDSDDSAIEIETSEATTPIRRKHLVALHAAGEHATTELAELFNIGRSTLYRALERSRRQT